MTKVYLIGAGPGDPDLITWKGRKLLAIADAVLYDHLAPEALLDLFRLLKEAEKGSAAAKPQTPVKAAPP